MTVRTTRLWLLTALLVAGILSGCGLPNAQSPVAEKAPQLAALGAKIEGNLESGYPSDMPLWPGAKVVSSKHTTSDDFDVYDLSLRTTDDFEKVVYGYAEGLRKAGFAVEQVDQSDSLKVITATGKDISAYLTFTITDDQQTEVTASIQL